VNPTLKQRSWRIEESDEFRQDKACVAAKFERSFGCFVFVQKLKRPNRKQMTQPRAHFTEQEFHAAQKKRLRALHAENPLRGPWADKLTTELKRRLGDHIDSPADHHAVIDCFASTPQANIDQLMFAVQRACEANGRPDEASAIWATELTVYAAVRSMDRDNLMGLSLWNGTDVKTQFANVMSIPTSSSLIACISLAALRGIFIRLGPLKQPRGMYETGSLEKSLIWTSTLVVDSFLGKLYDEIMRSQTHAMRNPNAQLTEDQKGQLRNKFADFRDGEALSCVFIETMPLDEDGCEAAARALADVLNTAVLRGSTGHSSTLLSDKHDFNVSSLKAKVEEIFALLSASDESATSTKTAATASVEKAKSVDGHSTVEPLTNYKWDVFVSHASEDKTAFVNAFVDHLIAAGLAVWYDKFEITAGDNLTAKVNEGLRESRFGVVVFSPYFLAKGWPEGELNSLMAHELTNGVKRVLPVLHEISFARLSAHFPMLSAKLALYANQGIPHVVTEIKRAVDVAKLP
jgi:hypothetical protein